MKFIYDTHLRLAVVFPHLVSLLLLTFLNEFHKNKDMANHEQVN